MSWAWAGQRVNRPMTLFFFFFFFFRFSSGLPFSCFHSFLSFLHSREDRRLGLEQRARRRGRGGSAEMPWCKAGGAATLVRADAGLGFLASSARIADDELMVAASQ